MHPCHSYLRHGTAQNERVSRLSQLLHSISHCPAAVVGTRKVFVPPVPPTTTPTYVVTSLTHSLLSLGCLLRLAAQDSSHGDMPEAGQLCGNRSKIHVTGLVGTWPKVIVPPLPSPTTPLML
jgi:hypothetical protein